MSRRGCLTLAALFFSATSLFADDAAIWREYGLILMQITHQGKLTVTEYQMKDTTGALAAWEWLRPPAAHSCDLAALCSQDANRTVVSDFNWTVVVTDGQPSKAEVASIFQLLPNKRDSALPTVLTYLPEKGLVPNSARYVSGPAALAAFAPELASTDLGFDRGAEAQIAQYRLRKDAPPMRLVVFYYPTPEIARIHTTQLRRRSDLRVKRSGVLVALTLPPGVDTQLSDTLLSRVKYNARVIEDDLPPPSPIRPLYLLLRNILYTCMVLSGVCVLAGFIYAGMRIYRRRYGTLDSEESMTTLHLTGD